MRIPVALAGLVLVVVVAAGTAAAQPSTRVKAAAGGRSADQVTGVVSADEGIANCVRTDTRGIHATAAIKVDAGGKVTRVKLAKLPSKFKKCVTAAVKALAFAPANAASTATLAIDTPAGDSVAAVALVEEPGVDGTYVTGDDTRAGATPAGDLAAQINAAKAAGTGTPAPPPAGKPGPRLSGKRRAPTATGPISGDVLLYKIMMTYFKDIKRCYTTALATDPTLAGTLIIAFDVGPKGKTSAVVVTGPAAACVQKLAETWTFPKADETTHGEIQFDAAPN